MSDQSSTIYSPNATAKFQSAAGASLYELKNQDVCKESLSYLPIQCSLTVGAVDDPLEHEAEAMADTVMRMPQQNFIQRKCSECKKEEEELIHRKPLSSFIQRKQSSSGVEVSDKVSQSINSSKGNGSKIESSTRTFMENSFGADFSNVNIHIDTEASQLNRELNAKAFTIGNDIYFNERQYDPVSDSGKHLLAHELTHTLQQSGTIQRDPNIPPGNYLNLDPDLSRPQLSGTRAQRGLGDFTLRGGLVNPLGLTPPSVGLSTDPTLPAYFLGVDYNDRCLRSLRTASVTYTRDLDRTPGGGISQSDNWGLEGSVGISAGGYRLGIGASGSFRGDNLVGGGLTFSLSGESPQSIPAECLSQPGQPGGGTGTGNTRPPGGNTGGGDVNPCANINCDRPPLPGYLELYRLCCIGHRPPGGDTSPAELHMPTIYFYYDTPVPKPESNDSLAHLLQLMQMFPSLHVQVSGHTSTEGRERYNQGLSQRRADHVRIYLQMQGIDSSRITTLALGETAPAVTEPPEPRSTSLRMPEGEAIRDLNRRAEIELFDPSGQSPYFPLTPSFILSTRGLSVSPPSRLERGGLLGSPVLRW